MNRTTIPLMCASNLRTKLPALLFSMNRTTTLLSCACLVLSALQATAQSGAAIQQMDSLQQRRQLDQAAGTEADAAAPKLYPDEESDVGPQTIIQFQPRKTHFEAMGDVQYFYTDNVALADNDSQEADVLVSTVQFALAPTPYDLAGGKFTPRVGYRHQWFNFGLLSDESVTVFDFNTASFRVVGLDEFDFNAQTAFTDMRWTHGNWIAGLGFDFTRLMDSSDYKQFYREAVPRWSLHRLFPLSETCVFSAGYEGTYRFTDTDLPPPGLDSGFNDRTDHSLVLSFTHSICPQALLQPYYRFRYTQFTGGEDREDCLNSFGLALYCFITPQINLRAFIAYEILDTSGGAFAQDYEKLDTGGGLNLTIRF